MDRDQPRQSIIHVVLANREMARSIHQRMHTLQRLHRGPSPTPERKEPPAGKSLLDLSNEANSFLTDSLQGLDRLIEDLDLRDGQSGSESPRQSAKQWAGGTEDASPTRPVNREY